MQSSQANTLLDVSYPRGNLARKNYFHLLTLQEKREKEPLENSKELNFKNQIMNHMMMF